MFSFYCFMIVRKLVISPLYCLSMYHLRWKSKQFKSYLIGKRTENRRVLEYKLPWLNVAVRPVWEGLWRQINHDGHLSVARLIFTLTPKSRVLQTEANSSEPPTARQLKISGHYFSSPSTSRHSSYPSSLGCVFYTIHATHLLSQCYQPNSFLQVARCPSQLVKRSQFPIMCKQYQHFY